MGYLKQFYLYKVAIFFTTICLLLVIFANAWVIIFDRTSDSILTGNTRAKNFAIVLGAGVRGENLSGILKERMLKAISLYQNGLIQKILITGDGTGIFYNETKAMTKFALRNNVPSESLLTDQEGFSTLESLYRAKTVFNINEAYIITQPYHLTRAIWIANMFGIDATGMPPNLNNTDLINLSREIVARTKDFFCVWYIKFTENL